MVMIREEARMSRQAQIIHPDLLRAGVVIGGVGMLGSWTALALARCCATVTIYDPDEVEDVNSGNQAYHGMHSGLPKVRALADLASGLPLRAFEGLFPLDKSGDDILHQANMQWEEERPPLVVISAVDSFEARKAIANWAHYNKAAVFVDTRAQAEIAVTCIVPGDFIPKYLAEETITDEEAPDEPCGLNGTGYVGMRVASRVCGGLQSFFSGMNPPFVLVENVRTGDILRSEPRPR